MAFRRILKYSDPMRSEYMLSEGFPVQMTAIIG